MILLDRVLLLLLFYLKNMGVYLHNRKHFLLFRIDGFFVKWYNIKNEGGGTVEKRNTLRTASAHKLFSEMDEEAFSLALSLFDGKISYYKKGENLRAMGAPFLTFGLVLLGTVQVFSLDMDGEPQMMANVGEGESFGESLAYLSTEDSPVTVLAATDATVLWLDITAVRAKAKTGDAFALSLTERFASVLALRALFQNDRIQILSKSKIRDRIVTFLSQCERRFGSRTFIIPFDRSSLAVYLGVNRAALSRELAKMKAEGMIDFFRSSFRLL